jgi:glutaconyl-CoA/methylmalonyl-CoA decarboxylase subunit gamma
MWLKKRYVLDFGEDRLTATLIRDRLGGLAVQMDGGDPVEIDACVVQNGRALSLRRNGRMHLIDLTARDSRGHVETTVDGRPRAVAVVDELKAMARVSSDRESGNGAIRVDIPGLVVALNAAVGQDVQKGETLLVLEAMKMQNDITAPVSGTVVSLNVEVGKSVNTGDLLLVIEPESTG